MKKDVLMNLKKTYLNNEFIVKEKEKSFFVIKDERENQKEWTFDYYFVNLKNKHYNYDSKFIITDIEFKSDLIFYNQSLNIYNVLRNVIFTIKYFQYQNFSEKSVMINDYYPEIEIKGIYLSMNEFDSFINFYTSNLQITLLNLFTEETINDLIKCLYQPTNKQEEK